MVRIRLQRAGRKNQPIYRVVIADKKAPRDGRFIAKIGHYIPTGNKECKIDMDIYNEWLSKGAQPTDRVKHLVETYYK